MKRAISLVAVTAALLIGAGCGGDDGNDSTGAADDSAGVAAPQGGAAGNDDGCSWVDSDTVRELFGVAPNASENTPIPGGGTSCFFKLDAEGSGIIYIGRLDENGQAGYDSAVSGSDLPGDLELAPVDVGDEAVAGADSGIAEVHVLSGDTYLGVTATVPSENPLSESSKDLLTATIALAEIALG